MYVCMYDIRKNTWSKEMIIILYKTIDLKQ